MNCTASVLPYRQTGYFSKIVLDYIENSGSIRPFISHAPTSDGIIDAIEDRKKFNTDRKLLVRVLNEQYASIETSAGVQSNIQALLADNTFTVCTAHQPNIFTGHLYFVYKILHTVKLAESLSVQHPGNHFVPVYYMGSEDADLEELGHVFIEGTKYEWKTKQTGAVGRMKVDEALLELLEVIAGQLLVHPHGTEIVELMRSSYKLGQTIEQATFRMVNELFAAYGLVILLPDNTELKRSFAPIIEKELLTAFSHQLVQETVAAFPPDYKVQASGREINMFYLADGQRERIEQEGEMWKVLNSEIQFTKAALANELTEHPERFSPNVILRPVLQEWLLPNIAFIGGGGEIAYWLQLKRVFEVTGTPYPVLVVRNSFLFVTQQAKELAAKLGFALNDLFAPETFLANELVKRDTSVQLSLANERILLDEFYNKLKTIAGNVDPTLANHTEALQQQGIKRLNALEKKLLRAEKKKFDAQLRQLSKLMMQLFPNKNLQERVDNLMPYYSRFGKDFLSVVFHHSLSLEQQFTILIEE